MSGLIFDSISVNHWRQFRSIDISFSPDVTILTGRNGTGKTTILNLLAKHAEYNTDFLGSPLLGRDERGRFTSGVWLSADGIPPVARVSVGKITYSDKSISNIDVDSSVSTSFNPSFTPSRRVNVLNIPSHRRLPSYKNVESIPTKPITRELALRNYQDEFWNGVRGERTRTTPLTKMKEALISMAAFGFGNARVSPDLEAQRTFSDFENRLHQIIPKNIGFRRVTVSIPDVVIETDSGNFLIDASSGGLMSLIDITWQITLFGREKERFVVIVDEPENHLHPSMQREFMPALISAFPQAQFIIATHSPFVVSSVKGAAVYAFDITRAEDYPNIQISDLSAASNAVVAVPVDVTNNIDADQILQRVLGVPVSVPIWAEEELSDVLESYGGGNITAEDIRKIHSELDNRGLSQFFPEVVSRGIVKNEKP